MDEEESKIKIHVTAERMQRMKVGLFRKAETSISARFEFIAYFMVNGNDMWLSKDEALALLDDLELQELDEVAAQVRDGIEKAAVPNM